MKIKILAIGTELAEGQVINTNAAFLGAQLCSAGATVSEHRVVEDDCTRIISACRDMVADCDHLFVLGGLGPTRDDITRDAVGSWQNKKLDFYPASWEKIVQRYSGWKLSPPASNRQQCFYPAGSQVLDNQEGTADAFYLNLSDDKRLWVLPGPPREVAYIWNVFCKPYFKEALTKSGHIRTLKRFLCLGLGESHLAEIVEKVTNIGNYEVGYRAHAPYVQVKVWQNIVEEAAENPDLKEVRKVLRPWLVAEDFDDLKDDFKTCVHLLSGKTLFLGGSADSGLMKSVCSLRDVFVVPPTAIEGVLDSSEKSNIEKLALLFDNILIVPDSLEDMKIRMFSRGKMISIEIGDVYPNLNIGQLRNSLQRKGPQKLLGLAWGGWKALVLRSSR